jgi:hypothetical protein
MGNHRNRYSVGFGGLSAAWVNQVVHQSFPSLPAPAADGRSGHGALVNSQACNILGWFPGIGDADGPTCLAGGNIISV